MQDGIDLITALALHPETARRLAAKFWNFFVSEIHAPDPSFLASMATVYLQSRHRDRPGRARRPDLAVVQQSVDALRALLVAGGVRGPGDQGSRLAELLARQGARRRWPTWARRSTSRPTSAAGRSGRGGSRRPRCWRGPTSPPRWPPARRTSSPWPCEPEANSPQALMAAMLERVTPAPFDSLPQQALLKYIVAGGAWSGSESQGPPGLPGSHACSSPPPSISWSRRGAHEPFPTTVHP